MSKMIREEKEKAPISGSKCSCKNSRYFLSRLGLVLQFSNIEAVRKKRQWIDLQLKEIWNQFSLVEKKWNPFLLPKLGEEFIFDVGIKFPIFSRKISSVPTGKFLRSSYSGRPIDSFCRNEGRNVTAQCTDVASLRENSLRHAEKMSEKRRGRWEGEEGRSTGGCYTRRLIQTSSEDADTHCDHMFST